MYMLNSETGDASFPKRFIHRRNGTRHVGVYRAGNTDILRSVYLPTRRGGARPGDRQNWNVNITWLGVTTVVWAARWIMIKRAPRNEPSHSSSQQLSENAGGIKGRNWDECDKAEVVAGDTRAGINGEAKILKWSSNRRIVESGRPVLISFHQPPLCAFQKFLFWNFQIPDFVAIAYVFFGGGKGSHRDPSQCLPLPDDRPGDRHN